MVFIENTENDVVPRLPTSQVAPCSSHSTSSANGNAGAMTAETAEPLNSLISLVPSFECDSWLLMRLE